MINIEEIRKNPGKQNWCYLCEGEKLSEEFIREFQDKVIWDYIVIRQKLSEGFIREFQNKVNWYDVCEYQKLSEGFIREFCDKVNWTRVFKYQKLSEEFIIEFQGLVDWYYVFRYQKLSSGFRKEFSLSVPGNSWLYLDIGQKKECIKANHPEYEIVGNKLIAYKSTRSDGYSVFNFQYHYEVGGEYECHADCNSYDDYSFGLSAWTKRGALSYHDTGKLFKVEIDLEDLGCVVYNGKIRARKIKILEEIPKEDWYK